jgi:hypothetical protein
VTLAYSKPKFMRLDAEALIPAVPTSPATSQSAIAIVAVPIGLFARKECPLTGCAKTGDRALRAIFRRRLQDALMHPPFPKPVCLAANAEQTVRRRSKARAGESCHVSHFGACDGFTTLPSGRLKPATSAISVSDNEKSKIARFSANRPSFDVRGMTTSPC